MTTVHRPRIWWVCPLAILALAFAPTLAVAEEAWTVEDCAACHEDQVLRFARSPHSVLDSQGKAAKAGASMSCTACHGNPTEHIGQGGDGPIFTFGPGQLPNAMTERCQTCHADTHPRFLSSAHARAGLTCASCHSTHSPEPTSLARLKRSSVEVAQADRLGAATESCRSCHEDVFTQFAFNERHRLQEGILDCTSCHNPHEPSQRLMLGGFKQEACVKCHADKDGPFIFEHASSRTEGCVACHTPHGSANRHMLKFQSVADACYGCHATVPGFHTRFTSDTVCTNCHSAIHGSNFHEAFLK